MASAIPAAIGAGGSIIGGIQGKGAAKRQERIQRDYLAMLKPLLDTQAETGRFALGQSKPFIRGAGQALQDLQEKFYKPLALGSRSAIDAFLSPERRAINQGYQNAVGNVARFAPRGGGRVSALVRGDLQRQGQLSDLVFGARKAGAEGLANTSTQLGGLGVGLLGAGFGAGQQATGLLRDQMGIAAGARESSSSQLAGIGESLGGFLGKVFENRGKSKSTGNAFDDILRGQNGAFDEGGSF